MSVTDKLNVTVPEPSYYEYTKISKAFPFTQFGNGVSQGHLFDNIYHGDRMIYLKVPENLELQIDPDIYYEYID